MDGAEVEVGWGGVERWSGGLKGTPVERGGMRLSGVEWMGLEWGGMDGIREGWSGRL